MIALLLSIVSATVIFVVFKLFSIYKINTLHAIVVNYLVACSCGLYFQESEVVITEIANNSWFIFAVGLGALFITVFNLMALTTQRSGLSVVSVATKMSVVIPVVFGLVYYEESLGILKFTGIILALLAVYLTSNKTANGLKIKPSNLIFPILVFLGSGIIDTSLKYLQGEYVARNDTPIFSATIFAAAAALGIFLLIVHSIQGKFQFKFKNVLAGIALGIPNYFSVYFLVQALRSDIFESSGIFTVNNVAVVIFSTIVGIMFFKEKLRPQNRIGIGLAVLGIILIALEKW
ncbi:EamA/RhaT family transporter [Aequorivita sp. SDUM287046]|uniref:EamA/RhaT family transporter n=1 Tax=Aequorivita aurantiaca TaxID=3053356 RepID=A0ABT8DJD0_9FLAO|nr:EamA/RhaT family transporter [Aequorivita aurantiaca]MDN3725433.1 EamA/RhaT family transporter [Aequorivita aurantiaca]